MAADGISPALAIRSSVGVELWHTKDTHKTYTPSDQFSKDESKFCRAIAYSPDGRYLAWANGTKVQVATVDTWKVICTLPRPRALSIKFSPNGTYLATLEHFSTPKDGSEPQPNYCVYETATGNTVYGLINKSFSDDWVPSWSNDEAVYALMHGGEAYFFETNGESGYTKPAHRIGACRGGELSIAGSGSNPHVGLYVPGTKGQPSVCKVFRYPALEANQVITAKSFFQADRVEMHWNKRASGLLLMTSMEVDSTGASYYGKQTLHYMNTKGDSCTVPLNKDGPIHAIQWSPKGNEFCVVFGFMPAKATFFNLKCDPIFEVSDAPRNSIYYSPFGNIVLLAGFGNLRGNVEVWDVAAKKLMKTFQAPDSTMLQWGPGGETILTATTAPRLRIGNGFKVWHYSGALLHETHWPAGQELLEVCWQTYPDGTFKENPISYATVEGIQQSQPQASKAVYVPPNIRSGGVPPPSGNGGGGGVGGASQYRPGAYTASERPPIPGLPIGYKVSQGQKKRDRKTKPTNQANPPAQGNAPTRPPQGSTPPKPAQGNTSPKPAQSDANSENPSASIAKKNNNQRKKPSPVRPAAESNVANNGNSIPSTNAKTPAEGTNHPNATENAAKSKNNKRNQRRAPENKSQAVDNGGKQAQQVNDQLKQLQLDDKPKKDAQKKPKPANSVAKSVETKASNDLVK